MKSKLLLRQYIVNTFRSRRYTTTGELRNLVKLELSDQTQVQIPLKLTLFKFIEQLITKTKTGKRINPKTKQRFAADSHKAYQNTLKVLERFEKHSKTKLDFDSIDLAFYNDFKDYLLYEEKISNNYWGLHIKNIKLFMNGSFEFLQKTDNNVVCMVLKRDD